MKLNFLLAVMVLCELIFSQESYSQTYLSEDFEGTFSGSPSAPGNWSQTTLYAEHHASGLTASGTIGDKVWEQNTWNGSSWSKTNNGTAAPGAFSGSNVLYLNDHHWAGRFNAVQSARTESPEIDLAGSTSPYIRFHWFNNQKPGEHLSMRVMISPDGGSTWHVLSQVVNGFSIANLTWDKINLAIPPIYRTANCKIGFEMSNHWGNHSAYLDMVMVHEYIPPVITSIATGDWYDAATWSGGVIPTSDNHVVIAAGHTVSVPLKSSSITGNITRCQDLTINGALDYGNSILNVLQAFGNILISSGGEYNAFNHFFTTTGRIIYCGGNFTIQAGGSANMSAVSTSQPTRQTSIIGAATGIAFTNNQSASFTNNGILTGNYIPHIMHLGQGDFIYNSPVICYRTFGLYLGEINTNGNLTLGNSPTISSIQRIERSNGNFISAPIWNNNNIASRNISYYSANWVPLTQTTIQTGFEIEQQSGNRIITGSLELSTHNHVQLSFPLLLGTSTTGSLALFKGILITTPTNLLTTSSFVNLPVGLAPTSNTPPIHGSYISGPIKINFPPGGSAPVNIPLGLGTSFNGPTANANVLKTITIAPGTANNQKPIISLESQATGTANLPLNTLMGSKTVRLNLDGGTDFPSSASISMTGVNNTFGNADNLTGLQNQLRIAQSSSHSGPWTERSSSSGSGAFVNNTYYARTTSTTSPGPIGPLTTLGEYFTFASTQPLTDIGVTSLVSPSSNLCYLGSQPVIIRVRNHGSVSINFATTNLTVTCNVTGAATATLTGTITSGILAPSDSLDVTMSTFLNMTATGTYTFNAFTTLSGDGNSLNDAMTAKNLIKSSQAIVAVQNGNWNDPSTWCGNIIPTTSTDVLIPLPISVTINTAGAKAQQITIDLGGKLEVPSGDLEVGPWAECGGDKSILNNGTLEISGGQVKVAGRVNVWGKANFTMSAGELLIDPDGTVSKISSGVSALTFTGGVNNTPVTNVTGGKITFIDPHPTNGSRVLSFETESAGAHGNWTGSTIQLGDPSNSCTSTSNNDFRLRVWLTNGGFLQLGNLIVNTNGGSTGRRVYVSTQLGIGGDFTVKSNSYFENSVLVVNGDIMIEPGAMVTASTLIKGRIEGLTGSTGLPIGAGLFPGTVPSSITNLGTLRPQINISANCINCVDEFYLNVNPGADVTLNSPLRVLETLYLTEGVLNTSFTNILSMGTVSPYTPGTIVQGNGYINGPMNRPITASTGSTYFPIGNAGHLRPVNIDFTTAPSNGGSLTVGFINNDPGNFGLPLTDGAITIDAVAPAGYWQINAEDGLAAGTYSIDITGTGFHGINNPAALRVIKRPNPSSPWSLQGTHVDGIGVTASRSGLSGFSDFAIASSFALNPVPVSLINFSGTYHPSGNVLRWTTTNEQNSSGFEIQRSLNGQSFSRLAFTESKALAGNSQLPLHYLFRDADKRTGTIYYRLRQYDLDNSSKLSHVIRVTAEEVKGLKIMEVYPNPVQDILNLVVSAGSAQTLNLAIADNNGRLVRTFQKAVVPGMNNFSFQVNKLAKGNYFIKLISRDQKEIVSQKFQKQ